MKNHISITFHIETIQQFKMYLQQEQHIYTYYLYKYKCTYIVLTVIQHSDGELAYIMVYLVLHYSFWFCCTKGQRTCNISPPRDGQQFFKQLALEITGLLLCSSSLQVSFQCLIQKNILHILVRSCLDLNSWLLGSMKYFRRKKGQIWIYLSQSKSRG